MRMRGAVGRHLKQDPDTPQRPRRRIPTLARRCQVVEVVVGWDIGDPRYPHVVSGKVKPFQPKAKPAGPPNVVHHAAVVGPSAATNSSSQASLSSAAPRAAETRTPEDEEAVQHAFKNIFHSFLAYHVPKPPESAAVPPPLVTPSIVYAVATPGEQGAEVPDESHAAGESQGSTTASVPVAASTEG